MSRTSAWMPWYIGDYLRDTGHLSNLADIAYRRLIEHYWQRGALRPEDSLLARIARLTLAEWHEVKRDVLEFFKLMGDRLRHKRIDIELDRARAVLARRKAARAKRKAKANPGPEFAGVDMPEHEPDADPTPPLGWNGPDDDDATTEYSDSANPMNLREIHGAHAQSHFRPASQPAAHAREAERAHAPVGASAVPAGAEFPGGDQAAAASAHCATEQPETATSGPERATEPAPGATDPPIGLSCPSPAAPAPARPTSHVPDPWRFGQPVPFDRTDPESCRAWLAAHPPQDGLGKAYDWRDALSVWAWHGSQGGAAAVRPPFTPAPDPLGTGMADIVTIEGHPTFDGWQLDVVFGNVLAAARMDPATSTATWKPLMSWLAAGIRPDEFLPVIRKIAGRDGYQAVRSIGYFSEAIRKECRGDAAPRRA